MASSLLKGNKKGISAVIALAARHGMPRDTKGMDLQPAAEGSSRKSVRIEKILNGFKIIWSKVGDYRDQEAHAPTWASAFKVAGAYMNGSDSEPDTSDTSEKAENEG